MRLCVILIIACLLQACPSSASDIDYFLDDSVPLTQLTSTPPSVPDAASSPASTSAVTPSANPAPLPPLPEYQRHHNIKSSAQDDVLKVDPAVLKACLEWQNRETDIESDALSFSPIWAICIANAAFLFGYATASCCSHKSTHTSSESAHEHEQMTNFRFLSWLWRSVLLILALSFIVECIHSYGHAHSEYLHALGTRLYLHDHELYNVIVSIRLLQIIRLPNADPHHFPARLCRRHGSCAPTHSLPALQTL
jgi:hypothetical protein